MQLRTQPLIKNHVMDNFQRNSEGLTEKTISPLLEDRSGGREIWWENLSINTQLSPPSLLSFLLIIDKTIRDNKTQATPYYYYLSNSF